MSLTVNLIFEIGELNSSPFEQYTIERSICVFVFELVVAMETIAKGVEQSGVWEFSFQR